MNLSLNLLPPDRKQALRTGYVFVYAQTMLLLFALLTVIATVTIFSVRVLVSSTYDDLSSRNTSTTDEFKDVAAEIKEINAYLVRTEVFDKHSVMWSEILKIIGNLAPSGTRLSRVYLSADGKITLSGVASTRTDVLTYGERLRGDGHFQDVKSPLSNILQQRDVKFDFEMRLTGVEPVKKP